MKTVLIHPGYLEGKRHFKRLSKLLVENNWKVIIHDCHITTKTQDVSIHISHSGGVLCKTLERAKKPKLIVAPPIINHKIKRKMIAKIFGDLRWALNNHELIFWAYKTTLSIAMIFSHKKWYFMLTSMKEYSPNLDSVLGERSIKVIANSDDPFSRMLCDDTRCITIKGHHDDILYRPKHYVFEAEKLVARN